MILYEKVGKRKVGKNIELLYGKDVMGVQSFFVGKEGGCFKKGNRPTFTCW